MCGSLAVWPSVAGIGVGGVLASGQHLAFGIFLRPLARSVISTMVVGYSAGAIVGGSISTFLIAAFGWRSAFVFGGACSTILLPAVLALPESLDFILASKTRNGLQRANAVLKRLGHQPITQLPEITREEKATRAVLGAFEGRFLESHASHLPQLFHADAELLFRAVLDAEESRRFGFFASNRDLRVGAAQCRRHNWRHVVRYLAGKSSARKVSRYCWRDSSFASWLMARPRAVIVPVMTAAFVTGFFMIGSMASLYAIVPRIYPALVRIRAPACHRLRPARGGRGSLSWRASDRAGWQRFAYYSVLALPVLISAVAIRSVPLFGERAEAKGKPYGARHCGPWNRDASTGRRFLRFVIPLRHEFPGRGHMRKTSFGIWRGRHRLRRGFEIAHTTSAIEAQPRAGVGLPRFPGIVGGQDMFGPYNVVKGAQGHSTVPGNENWTWGAGQSIYAESRTASISSSGASSRTSNGPRPSSSPNSVEHPIPIGRLPFRDATVSALPAPAAPAGSQRRHEVWKGTLGVDAKWENCITVVDHNGNIIERWTQWDKILKRPAFRRRQFPMTRRNMSWVVDDHMHAIYKFTHDGKTLVQTIGTRPWRRRRHTFQPPDLSRLASRQHMFVADGLQRHACREVRQGRQVPDGVGTEGYDPDEKRPGYMNNVHGIAVRRRRTASSSMTAAIIVRKLRRERQISLRLEFRRRPVDIHLLYIGAGGLTRRNLSREREGASQEREERYMSR